MKRTMEIAEIIHLYQDGASTAEIAKLANISARYVRLILKEQNIEKRPFGHWKRQYSINEDYFKTWSNTMAYILGFFVADGFVGNNAQQIGFAQKERYILEQIRDELGSDQPIYLNQKTGVFMLHINSKVMRQDLIEIHNIKPHKSLDVEFPYIPEDYLHHFIRGYFDGDGNVEYRNYTVSFVGGSLNFMVELKEILKKKGFKPYLRSNNAHYRVIIAGRRSIKLFSNWIYKDKDLFLQRKYNEFHLEHDIIENLNDAKHRTNKSAVKQRKALFLEKFILNNCIKQTCEEIGIKYSTYYSWLKRDLDFKEAIETIKNNAINIR